MQQQIKHKLLLSRLLTRSGDQAWDFALPLALIVLFPNRMELAIGLFFLAKLVHTLLAPVIGSKIDTWPPLTSIRVGIFLQTLAVLSGGGLIWLQYLGFFSSDFSGASFIAWYLLVTATIIAGNTGAMIMDIYVTQELIPALFKDSLTHINARVRQLDLASEVGSPVIAGFLIAATLSYHPLAGFTGVILWNTLSFIPEFWLIRTCCLSLPADSSLTAVQHQLKPQPLTIFKRYALGYRSFFRHRLAIPMLAYSMLWFSALSPHGVLLTTFLKGGWQLPENELGVFRALGAVFGVSATFVFPLLVRKWKLLPATALFILIQTIAVFVAFLAFIGAANHWLFLAAILFSRIGLYGFMQGETEMRQLHCAPGERGRINGFASAMNQSATLLLFLAGSFLMNPTDFIYLTAGSVFFVAVAATLFLWWVWKHRNDGY